jgi:hypothetical protein
VRIEFPALNTNPSLPQVLTVLVQPLSPISQDSGEYFSLPVIYQVLGPEEKLNIFTQNLELGGDNGEIGCLDIYGVPHPGIVNALDVPSPLLSVHKWNYHGCNESF